MFASLILAVSLAGQNFGGAPNLPPTVYVVPAGYPANLAASDLGTATLNMSRRRGFADSFPNRPPMGLPTGVYLIPTWVYSLRY